MHTPTLLRDDCFAVRQAARHISQLYDRHLASAGITPTQFTILTAVMLKGGQTMQELARTMVMERTTVLRALKPLIRDDLVAAKQDGDARRLTFHATASGRDKQGKAAVFWRDAQVEFEKTFGPSAAQRLRGELFRLTSNLSKTPTSHKAMK